MVNIQAAIIIGAMVAGAAIGGALFLLYPDMMFQGTSISGQSEFASDGITTAESPDTSTGSGYVAPSP